MKVFISCDIEGVAGITHWDEADRTHDDHKYFRAQMTRELSAACRGALAAGAQEIWVKDAHGSGRNLLPDELPKEVRLIRGWSGHPYCMMQEIDGSFDAAMMVGYHAMAQSGENPLAHSFSSRNLWRLSLNGASASEFVLNACIASLEKVPVVLVAGDEGVCAQAKEFNANISTVPVKRGVGDSTISLHPAVSTERIEKAAYEAMKGTLKECLTPLPVKFELKLAFKEHATAYRASFYPGARQIGPHEVLFETRDYFDVLRVLTFAY